MAKQSKAERADALHAKAEALKRAAEAAEREAHLEERMADAATIPTCPECGSRCFTVESWTTVGQTISYEQDEKDGEWEDDYTSGDHTDVSASASCAECHSDAQEVLEAHGWKFYADPEVDDTLAELKAKAEKYDQIVAELVTELPSLRRCQSILNPEKEHA